MKPACHKTKNKAFSDPEHATPQAIAAAKKMCAHCPILQDCARQALTSGTSLSEDHRSPAWDVLQAGVMCDGSIETAYRLASIARCDVPEFLLRATRRRQIGDRCKNCKRPMIKWTRGEAPEGYVKHRGRGFCTNCRKAYNLELAAARAADPEGTARRQYRRKEIDRKRHSAPTRKPGPVVIQLSLFDRLDAVS